MIYWKLPNNGGTETFEEFTEKGIDLKDLAIFMLENFELYYIDPWGMFHVHAGIPIDKKGVPGLTRSRLSILDEDFVALRDKFRGNWKDAFEDPIKIKELDRFFEREDFREMVWIGAKKWIDKIYYG